MSELYSKKLFREVVSKTFFAYYQTMYPVDENTKAVEIERYFWDYKYVINVDHSNIIYGIAKLIRYGENDQMLGSFGYAPEINVVYWHV